MGSFRDLVECIQSPEVYDKNIKKTKNENTQVPIFKYAFLLTLFQFLHQKSTATRILTKAVAQTCSVKNTFLKVSYNSQENTCVGGLFFDKVAGLIQYCEIFKKIFFIEHVWATHSALSAKKETNALEMSSPFSTGI